MIERMRDRELRRISFISQIDKRSQKLSISLRLYCIVGNAFTQHKQQCIIIIVRCHLV